MAAIVFIGDALTAAGFRLTGIETVVPPPGGTAAALDEARGRADIVLLTTACGHEIAADVLDSALLAEAPVVALVPDVLESAPMPDMARRLRAVLGIET